MCDVSVIVPVYNNESYIGQCIRSVQKQTLSAIEIIVINDGSTDASPAIVRRLMKEDPRIVLLDQENRGVSAARNRGVDHARGRYITFVDGDDYISDDYLDCLCRTADRYHAQMVIGGLTLLEEDGKVIQEIVPGHYRRFTQEEWPMRISAVCAHLYRLSFWKEHNLTFSLGERGEDIPLALYTAAMCSRICVVDHPGYYYVQHAGSAMSSLQGLRKYSIPYRGLEQAIQRVQREGIVNSPEFHEYFVLRILATFLFLLGPGSAWHKMKELCDYILYILDTYYPDYDRNPYLRPGPKTDYPIAQRISVGLLVFLVKKRLLYVTGRLLCLKKKR